jgi:hypothetical protein
MNDNNPAAQIADGEQAKVALERWLDPAFNHVISVYRERLEQIAAAEPWATDKIAKVAVAVKIAEEARNQISLVVKQGEIALANERQRRKIEELPTHKRRWAGMLPA